jgi:hypothetical protein
MFTRANGFRMREDHFGNAMEKQQKSRRNGLSLKHYNKHRDSMDGGAADKSHISKRRPRNGPKA